MGYTTVPDGLLILKYNKYGEIVWARNYGTSYNAAGGKIIKTGDGGYLVVGQIAMSGTYVLKLDSDGDTLWTRMYAYPHYLTLGRAVVQTPDGGYLITGSKVTVGPEMPNYLFLLKIDAYGDTLWSRQYYLLEYSGGRSIINSSAGGFIIMGGTYSYWPLLNEVFILKTNYLGYSERCIYLGDSLSWYYSGAIGNTNDSGYIGICTKEWIGYEPCGIILIKYDRYNNLQWQRIFRGHGSARGYHVIQTEDGGYIFTGKIRNSPGNSDLLVVKTDSIGSTKIEENTSSVPHNFSLFIYPNPFNSSCRIDAPLGSTIEIFNLNGLVVGWFCNPGSPDTRFTGSPVYIWHPDETVSSGIYLVRASKGKDVATQKILFIK